MRLFLASLLALSLFPACAQTSGSALSLDPKTVDTLGADLYQNTGATGLVLVVVRGNQVYFRGYGETVPGSGVTPSADSLVRLCSLTKIFTSDMLAKLVNDGAVHLDDPLQRYAPAGVAVPAQGTPITLLDLATHTSGLSREIGTAPRGAPHFTYPDYATRWAWLPRQHLIFEPGSSALYSNIGYDLLGDALGNAAHAAYPALLNERTLRPLGMRDTTFFPSDQQCTRLMSSSRHSRCTVTVNTAGSSGLYSTPADMALWLKYLLGSAAPAIPAQADDAHAIYLLPSALRLQSGLNHAGRPAGIGLGWMHLGANDDPAHLIEKTGGGAGFTTYIVLHPASHTALFVAATDGPPRRGATYFNIFKGANNAVLALAGLPPLADDPRRPPARVRARMLARAAQHSRTAHHTRAARVSVKTHTRSAAHKPAHKSTHKPATGTAKKRRR